MQMKILPLDGLLRLLAWLEGTWITEEPAVGVYPTIPPFNYYEELNITSIGQPMFNFVAQSWRAETGVPMHRETGYLYYIQGTNEVSLALVHNLGMFIIEEGVLKDKEFDLKSMHILVTDAARPPLVTQVYISPHKYIARIIVCNRSLITPLFLLLTQTRKVFKLIDEDHLEQVFYMATANTPTLTEHLRARYKRVA